MLSRAIELPYAQLGALVGCTLVIALHAFAIVAARVERKPHTLSIAGATFPTLLLIPIGIVVYNHWFAGPGASLPALPTLAALMTAYVIGEGLGLVYCLGLLHELAAPNPPTPDLATGIAGLWAPGLIVMLQAVGVTLFLHSGWSKVTGCEMDIHIHSDRV